MIFKTRLRHHNFSGLKFETKIMVFNLNHPCTTKVEAGLTPDADLSSDAVEATAKSVVRPMEGQLD